jgi:hypothetical protein
MILYVQEHWGKASDGAIDGRAIDESYNGG